jgi:hypothetical protein
MSDTEEADRIVDDSHKRRGTKRTAKKAPNGGQAHEAKPTPKPKKQIWDWRENLITLETLQNKEIPLPNPVIGGLIPEGFMLFAGRPKIGKSWFWFDIGIAVSSARITLGEIRPAQGDVLYLALEDTQRRLKDRAAKLLQGTAITWPHRMSVVTKWRRLGDGCLEAMQEWAESVENPRLIIMDTVPKLRPATETKDRYAADYRASERFAEFAGNHPGLAIVGNIHTRKLDAEDPFDTINATLGLSGGADTIGVLLGTPGAYTLHVTGRDVERSDNAVTFNRNTCKWTILGNANEFHQQGERERVRAALADHSDGLRAKEITIAANLPGGKATDSLLWRMHKDGEIERVRYGVYRLPGRAESTFVED